MSLIEREKERRANFRSRQLLSCQFKPDIEQKTTVVVDLSLGGFRAALPTLIEGPVQVTLRLLDADVTAIAEKRWHRELGTDLYQAGFEFQVFLDPQGRLTIQRFLDDERAAEDVQREQGSKGALRNLPSDELQRLALLAEVSKTLGSSSDYEEALVAVTDALLETLGAERGLVLLDRGAIVPSVEIARGKKARSERGLEFSQTVVRQVLETGEPLLSLDVSTDEVLSDVASLKHLRTSSILCVPMRSTGRNLGLLYLDSSSSQGLFTPADLELATIIADLAASAIERATYFSQLVQGEKMAALGTLVAGLVHELRNPLSTIIGLAEIWQEGDPRPDDPIDLLKAAKRCQRLIDDLLRSARGGEARRLSVNLSEVVDSIVNIVQSQFRRQGVSLNVNCPELLPKVTGDPEQLGQVVLNLLTNALTAVEAGEDPKVDITAAHVENLLRLTISDNGSGIPPENLRRIFDPFFTTGKAQGNGLGLSIIRRLVKEHNGTIRAGNRPTGGAIFTVELPLE